eukprot:15468251-Alexandrium_andersonii.AAC.1
MRSEWPVCGILADVPCAPWELELVPVPALALRVGEAEARRPRRIMRELRVATLVALHHLGPRHGPVHLLLDASAVRPEALAPSVGGVAVEELLEIWLRPQCLPDRRERGIDVAGVLPGHAPE